jgi:hypothetical protein
MLAPVSVAMIAALSALALSLLARRRRSHGRLEADDVVITLVLHAGLVGLVATLLACFGGLGVTGLVGSCVLLALLCWPWANVPTQGAPQSHSRALSLVLLALVGLGVGLRLPAIPAELAGRDQGTYVLRAHASARTGSLGWTDPVLAEAGRELASGEAAAGTYDILGLYPTNQEPWRRDHYDGAYRPGAYLGDRELGEVVPQFFHLHPMLLAVAGAAFGPEHVTFVLPWLACLWLGCLACCARRLWPRGPWAAVAVALVVSSPLAIWTARTPLSENPMALFEWTAVLVALRMRDSFESGGVEREDVGSLLVAGCLGLCAFTRGNAVLLLPIVLALAWLRPRGPKGAYLLLGSLLASIVVHAATTYPYMHDELLRQLPSVRLGPLGLIVAAALGALAWLSIDRVVAFRPSLSRLLVHVPRLLVLACFAAALLWWLLRRDAPPGRPFSRLDAAPILLGLPLLLSAGVGLLVVAWRWRPGPEQVWLVALASLVPATALLYATRQLPQLAFFYYGRYLVPELLPAAAMAATAALASAAAWLGGSKASWRRTVASGLGVAGGLGLLWSSASALLEHPQLRLREYEGAGAAVRWLAARLPDGAIVIAGGEGWHSGHTNNQIGGALAFSHGVEVLPYRTREDAWVTAWELLVAGPSRRGEPPPPVFLLVNEGAHQYTRRDGEGGKIPVALLDEQLWAPFSVERAALLELFVHALTPVPDQLPTRVARHELRMGLLRLQVDAEALSHIEQLEFGARPPVGISVRGGLHDDASTCVSPERPLTLTIPRSAEAMHMVVVAEVANEPMSLQIGEWSLRIDGVPIERPKGLPPRARATLGPIALPMRTDPEHAETVTLELLGVDLRPEALGPEPCRYGRVAAIYLLPHERSSVFELEPERVEVTTLEPPKNLGHAIVPTTWAAGRSLSRYRAGTTLAGLGHSPSPLGHSPPLAVPSPELVGLALRLPAGGSLTFAPIDLPRIEGPRSLDVVVTLAGTSTEDESQLHVYAGERRIGTVSPPPMRTGSWIAEPFVWSDYPDRAQLRVELESPAGSVELRDVALFVRPPE